MYISYDVAVIRAGVDGVFFVADIVYVYGTRVVMYGYVVVVVDVAVWFICSMSLSLMSLLFSL